MDPIPAAALVLHRVVPLDGFDQSLMKSVRKNSSCSQLAWLDLALYGSFLHFQRISWELEHSPHIFISITHSSTALEVGWWEETKLWCHSTIPPRFPRVCTRAFSVTCWCQAEQLNPNLLSLRPSVIALQQPGARRFPWMRWECAFPHFQAGATPLLLPA